MRKILSVVLSFGLLFQQSGLVYAVGELNLANYLSHARSAIVQPDQFRPPQLRYISYDIKSNDFKLLLDKGGAKLNELSNSLNSSNPKLNDATQELFNYFLIGLSLPNDTFWVNLRPDAPENIIDPLLEKTDIGKIFLEADLQLKKDTAGLTSPQNLEGKAYWDKLYKKAGELFGTENITIPTITRPWIVPNEVIVRETEDSAYIYKATLKVMLEEDYLRGMKDDPAGASGRVTIDYSFNDPRLKELNEYSTQLIRETIIPKLTKEINSSKRYAQLRQVYYSLVLARWFKQKYSSLGSASAPEPQSASSLANSYISLIDSRNLVNLASKESYDKQTYFQAYQKSFKDGEYNLKETVATPFGQSIRSYISGGLGMGFEYKAVNSPVTGIKVNSSPVTNVWTEQPPATTASPLTAEQEELINKINVATSGREFKSVPKEILYRIESIIEEITDVKVKIKAEDMANKPIMDLRELEGLDSLYWLEFIALLEKYSGVELLENGEDIEIKLGESVNEIVEDLRGRMSKENGGEFKGLLKLICRIEVDDLLKKVPWGVPMGKINEIRESVNKDKIGDAAFELGQIFLSLGNHKNADACNLIWKDWRSVTAGSPLTDAEARYILERDTRNIENIIYFSTLQYTDKDVLSNYLSNPVQPDIMSAVYKAGNIRLSNKNIEWLSYINVEDSFEADILLSKRYVSMELESYSAIPEISEMSKRIPSLLDHKDIGDFLSEVIKTLNKRNKDNSLEASPGRSVDDYDGKLNELLIRMYRKELARIIYSGVVRFSAQTFQAVENTLINDFVSQAVVDIKNAVKDAVAGNIESSREINIALESDLLFARLSDMEKKLSDSPGSAASPLTVQDAKNQMQGIVENWEIELRELFGKDKANKSYLESSDYRHMMPFQAYPLTIYTPEALFESISEVSKAVNVIPIGVNITTVFKEVNKSISQGKVANPKTNITDFISLSDKAVHSLNTLINRLTQEWLTELRKDYNNRGLMNSKEDEVAWDYIYRGDFGNALYKLRLIAQRAKIYGEIGWGDIYNLRRADEIRKLANALDDINKEIENNASAEYKLEDIDIAVKTLKGVGKYIERFLMEIILDPSLYAGPAFSLVGIKEFISVNDLVSASRNIAKMYNMERRNKDRVDFYVIDKELEKWNILKTKAMGNIGIVIRGIEHKINAEFEELTKKKSSLDRQARIDRAKQEIRFELERKHFVKVCDIMIWLYKQNNNEAKIKEWSLFKGEIEPISIKLSPIPSYPVAKAGSPLTGQAKAVSSSLKKQVGGIDLTDRMLNMRIERVGSFALSALALPEITNVEALDLDEEYERIQAMASVSIRPSDTRILEFAAACYYKGEFDQRLDQVSSCIKAAHLADELLGKESSPALRLATMLPDALYGG